MQLDKNNTRKIMLITAFAIVLLWALLNYSLIISSAGYILGILAPFIAGAGFAFIMNVPMAFIENHMFSKWNSKHKGLKRPVSMLLSLMAIIGVMALVVFIVVPELLRSFKIIEEAIPVYFNKTILFLQNFLINSPEISKWLDEALMINWEKIFQSTMSFLLKDMPVFLTSAAAFISTMVSVLVKVFMGFIFSIYVLSQKENLGHGAKDAIYAFANKDVGDRVIDTLAIFSRTFKNFIIGQCTEAVILGVMFFITMVVLKMPYAMMISTLIGFTALVPIFGAFVGCGVGTFLIFIENPMQSLVFLIVFLVVQQIEGNLIYPKVVGNSVGLPSLWVLLAVVVGGNLMGLLGMLLFIPTFASLYTIFKRSVKTRLDKRGIESCEIQKQQK